MRLTLKDTDNFQAAFDLRTAPNGVFGSNAETMESCGFEEGLVGGEVKGKYLPGFEGIADLKKAWLEVKSKVNAFQALKGLVSEWALTCFSPMMPKRRQKSYGRSGQLDYFVCVFGMLLETC